MAEEMTRQRKKNPTNRRRSASTKQSAQMSSKKRRNTVSKRTKKTASAPSSVTKRQAHAAVNRSTYSSRSLSGNQRRSSSRSSSFRANGLLGDYKKKWDTPLLLITLMLLFSGLISLMSASYPDAYYDPKIGSLYYFLRQGLFAGIGIVGMLFVSAFDYHRYHIFGKLLYVVSIITLIMVLTPLGTSINQAQRWLFGFQPSELAKLAIILTFSSFVSLHPERIRTIRGLIPYGAAFAVVALLLYKEPHVSAALIIAVIAVAILFVGGMRVWYFVPVGIVGTIAAVGAYLTLPHVQTRIAAWLHPFEAVQGKGWQAVQSLIAIGSGGLFGRGLGQSRQKFLYLPEPMNDFIFSVVCEELGFIGALLFLIMFAYFIYRGFLIARRAEDRYGSLIAVGITTQMAFQILMNLCVVTGIFPVTGASLPFFSYGGTALVMQLIEVGILLNISRHIPPSRKAERTRSGTNKKRRTGLQ